MIVCSALFVYSSAFSGEGLIPGVLFHEEFWIDAFPIAVFLGAFEASFHEVILTGLKRFLAFGFAFLEIGPVDPIADEIEENIADDGDTSEPDDETNKAENHRNACL